jgi:hypothetical protein
LYSAVISPAFASGRRARIASSSSCVTSDRTPPPFLRGATALRTDHIAPSPGISGG